MGRRITVIGGDLRQITVAESLAKDGFDVSVFGFDKKYVPSTLTIAHQLLPKPSASAKLQCLE